MKRKKEGPAVKVLARSVLKYPKRGICAFKGCGSKARTSRARWCSAHHKHVRRLQLRLNNQVWYRRVKRGAATHREVYAGKPTKYAKRQAARRRAA